MCETSKPSPIQINCQWVIRSTKGIDSHVEFPTTQKHGVHEVLLADIGFRWIVFVIGLPTGNISNPAEDEDPPTLAFRSGFHDPQSSAITLSSFELLIQNDILAR